MLRRETLPNLRFRLGEVLVEIVTHGMGLPGAMSNPIAAALSALSFLRSVNKLATIDLDRGDAELLITIFRLTRDHEVLDLDALIAASPEISEPRRAGALERLERLACITLGDGTVHMNETIIVQRT